MPGRKFGIKPVIWTNVSQRKEAGSQTQLREDALVQFLKLDVGLTDQLLLFFLDQQVSSSVHKEEKNCSGRSDWNIRIDTGFGPALALEGKDYVCLPGNKSINLL